MPNQVVESAEPVGDAAVAVRIGGSTAAEKLARLRVAADAVRAADLPGVTDVVASPGRLTVAYDPLAVEDVGMFGEAIVATMVAGVAASPATGRGGEVVHRIPVAYDGPDLGQLCTGLGLSWERFVAAHTEPEYLVEAIGFLPGFAYLAGLPAQLATPRRATPRRVVPAGSVGIGGLQTGVYPFASPGGWNLVGRSDMPLFDRSLPRPALLAVGDRVRFVAADLPPFVGTPRPPLAVVAGKAAGITVIEPGLFTTIQDRGRPGHRAAGVPLSGAVDGLSLRLANLLVGNDDNAAAIECTLLGPTLRFERDCRVALVGGDFPGLPAGAATHLPAGSEVAIGHATTGCRGYLAVAGGIDVEAVLGSRSTLVAAGFGGLDGRPLRAGDRLVVGADGDDGRRAAGPDPRAVSRTASRAPRDAVRVLRIIPGEQAATVGGRVWGQAFRTSSRSDRMGVRLEGEPVPVGVLRPDIAALAGMASVAVFPGTVQVPPDGQPIVLLSDAQTVGGYPVLGQVIAVDLPQAAQLRPGDAVRFEPVSLAEAHSLLRRQEAMIKAWEAGG